MIYQKYVRYAIGELLIQWHTFLENAQYLVKLECTIMERAY